MSASVLDYYRTVLEQFHFVKIHEQSRPGDTFYKMLTGYGEGSIRLIDFNDMFIILIADYTPKATFLKTSTITGDYLEISLFATGDSSYKVGGRKLNRVEKGIFCYINTSKQVQVHCEAGKPTRFTKILISKSYYDDFLKERYEELYSRSADAMTFFARNPNSPEISFVFQQMQGCKAVGTAQHIYMESKVLEILSLMTDKYQKSKDKGPLSVKLDKRDIRSLGKAVTLMKKNPAAYPSNGELAKAASMSATRFQLAFRKVYGTTAYKYLKEMRMNSALQLLKDSDHSIKQIAALTGYSNAGHFAGLFKKTYGLTPKQYRTMQGVK